MMTRQQNWVWVILSGVVIIAIVTTLLWLRQDNQPVLAQGPGDSETANSEALLNGSQGQPAPGDITILPLNASETERAKLIGSKSDNSGVEPVTSAAFRHDGSNANAWHHFFAGGYLRNNSSNAVCMMAPTYPPAGATLTAFSATLLDDYASGDIQIRLWRAALTNPDINSSEILGEIFVARDDPTAVEIFDNTITPGMAGVSNAYAYYVTACFPASSSTQILFYGTNLFYTPVP